MSNQNVSIVVEKVGPYGILAGGTWLGLSKGSNLSPSQFQEGQPYNVVIAYAKSGKAYIQSVEGGQLTAPPPPPPAPTFQAPPPSYVPAPVAAPSRALAKAPETADARQTSIVRQSSLAQAVAYVKGLNQVIQVDVVLDVASQFETWVNR